MRAPGAAPPSPSAAHLQDPAVLQILLQAQGFLVATVEVAGRTTQATANPQGGGDRSKAHVVGKGRRVA